MIPAQIKMKTLVVARLMMGDITTWTAFGDERAVGFFSNSSRRTKLFLMKPCTSRESFAVTAVNLPLMHGLPIMILGSAAMRA